MRSLLLISSFFLLAGAAPAADVAPDPDRPLWLRYPAVSPSGDQVAFCSGGQIWVAPVAGGDATPLTSALFYSAAPVWSPDGSQIAFSSARFGNRDVFVVPVKGGEIRRLTYSSADDEPTAFSPDGKNVFFASRRLGDSTATFFDGGGIALQLYTVPAAGGREALVIPTPALCAQPNATGDRILYESLRSYEQPWRKHAISDAARDIWVFEPKSGDHRQLTDFRGEDRNPVWAADGKAFYYLSERSGNSNIWRQSLDGSTSPTQITRHETHPVRYLTSARDGSLVYFYNGELWRLAAGATEPARIAVRIRQSTLLNGEFSVQLNKYATEIAVSPSGQDYAIIARGEVFTVSSQSGQTRRITNTPVRESGVRFSPDGRALLYAAERNGKWGLHESVLVRGTDESFTEALEIQERVVIDTDADETQPAYSPDGKRIAYLESRDQLRVLDRTTSQVIRLSGSYPSYSYQDGDISFVWSPDGRWIAATSGVANNGDVYLVDPTGAVAPINVSRSGSSDGLPVFGPDSQVLYFGTGRHGLRSPEGDPVQQDIYAVFLSRAAYEAYRDKGSRATEQTTGPWTMDYTGQQHRTVRLTPNSLTIATYAPTDNPGELAILAAKADGGLEAHLLNTGERTLRPAPNPPPAGARAVAIDDTGTSAHYLTASSIAAGSLLGPGTSSVDFVAAATYNYRAEMAYIFDNCVRLTEVKFYDTKLHGVDWRKYAARYREFLPYVTRWEDLADVLSELVGELNASHTRGNYSNPVSYGDETASLGLYFDNSHRDAGLKISQVLAAGPADHAVSQLKPGAVILSVNGTKITAAMGADELLNHQAGKVTRLQVRPASGGAPVEEQITPVTLAEAFDLAYEQWVARRKQLTRELSGGRIGYIHVPEMNSPSFQRAASELFGEYLDAEAVIVDVRYNRGGNLHDQLITMLTGERAGELVSNKGLVVARVPEGRWGRPSAVIANASSYSDGSVFPHFYKANKIGPLVGENVPGTGTAVWWEKQIEPALEYGVPEVGFRDVRNGRWLENQEITPDILVYNHPKAIAEGRDEQLEATVKALLERLK